MDATARFWTRANFAVIENVTLKRRIADLETEIVELKRQLAETQRAAKRQAAPFAKQPPKRHPKRPGQKPGHPPAQRPRPTPEQIDKIEDAPLPPACPDCGGPLTEDRIEPQFQVEIPPVRPVTTQFNVHIGHCATCHTHIHGRHPQQTSTALGAANLSLGPRALALAAFAKHELGVPYGKISRFFDLAFQMPICRATFARADQRLADDYLLAYAHLLLSVRHAHVALSDETGWRLGGHSAWLWVFTTDIVTVYVIHRSRAHAVAEAVLGRDFAGRLVTDCLLTYDALPCAQQKCLQHFIRRGVAIHTLKSGRAADFCRRAVALLRGAIHLRHRRQDQRISQQGFLIARGRLEAAMDRLLAKQLSDADNVRFAKSLRKHRHQLFPFLYDAQVPPTTAQAEQEIRPAVAIRKTSACNRSPMGAYAHQVLASIIRTCYRHDQDFIALTIDRLTNPKAPLPDWLTQLSPAAQLVSATSPP